MKTRFIPTYKIVIRTISGTEVIERDASDEVYKTMQAWAERMNSIGRYGFGVNAEVIESCRTESID